MLQLAAEDSEASLAAWTIFRADQFYPDVPSVLRPLPPVVRGWMLENGRYVDVPKDELPGEIAQLRILANAGCEDSASRACDRSSFCDVFESVDVNIPGSSRHGVGYVVALDEHSAMVASIPDELYLARDDGMSASFSKRIGPNLPYSTAFRAAGGEIWLFGPRGLLSHGDFERGFLPVAHSSTEMGDRDAWIDGTPDDAPFELFAVTDAGTFEHYDGPTNGWTEISHDVFRLIGTGGVVRLGPGEALASGLSDRGIVHYANGSTNLEAPASLRAGVAITSLGFVPGIGAVVGTTLGTIDFRTRTGRWSPLPAPEDGSYIRALTPFGDGFVFGVDVNQGSAGFIYQYRPSTGLCSPQPLTPGEIIEMHPNGNGLLVVSDPVNGGGLWISFVRKSVPSCGGT